MSELEEAALRAETLKVVSGYVDECYDQARAEVGQYLTKGVRWPVRTPDGVKLGTVSMSDPAAKARVVDKPAFERWAAEHYPQQMDRGYEIVGSDAEVKAVLFEHAPELLREVRSADRLAKATCSASAKLGVVVGPGGEADVPGIEVEHPDGVVSCLPAKDALGHVIQLFRDGRLSLESLAPQELPGGAE